MALKPYGGVCAIREQIIEDRATGLTFQFVHVPESDAPIRLLIFGDLSFGNREILFDKNGVEAGSGTLIAGSCRPSWLKEVSG